jgi:murein DD-endopeptidase MepM/ murein hydrolase activator NlpD
LWGRAGRNVTVEADDTELAAQAQCPLGPDDDGQFKRLVVEKTNSRDSHRASRPPDVSLQPAGQRQHPSSLFAATDEANIPDAVAVQLAEIFSGDIDFPPCPAQGRPFQRRVRNARGRWRAPAHRSGAVAEFVNNGKTYQAMWFQEPGQKGGYYTLDGQSLRRAYFASPMEFSRVTSGFKMRFHPILQKWRAHLGVDYAAPTGTPVRSVGDGVVEFAGVQNGFGNVVFISTATTVCHGVCPPEPHSTCARGNRSARARTWAPWAPQAGPPGLICTLNSVSMARTRTL